MCHQRDKTPALIAVLTSQQKPAIGRRSAGWKRSLLCLRGAYWKAQPPFGALTKLFKQNRRRRQRRRTSQPISQDAVLTLQQLLNLPEPRGRKSRVRVIIRARRSLSVFSLSA